MLFLQNLENIKDSIIEERIFEDEGEYFKNNYNSHYYREEMSLNADRKLFLILNNISFYYDFERNKMKKLGLLNEKHSGGALIKSHNHLYCILGRSSFSIEKFNLIEFFKMSKSDSWSTINSDGTPRAYFSTFIQNERILYIMFGYDFKINDYIRDFKKMDLGVKKKIWIDVKVMSNKIPKLSLAATISISKDKVYILGKIYF